MSEVKVENVSVLAGNVKRFQQEQFYSLDAFQLVAFTLMSDVMLLRCCSSIVSVEWQGTMETVSGNNLTSFRGERRMKRIPKNVKKLHQHL